MQSKRLTIIIAVAGLAFVLAGAGCNKQPASNTPDNTTPTTNKQPQNPNSNAGGTNIQVTIPAPVQANANVQAGANVSTSQTKTFNVEGGMFYFNPKEIRVKQGDTVRIVFTNKEGFHDWTIDEFNARTTQIAAGKTETIQFVADKTGTFEYYCSVGNHRAMGMKGNLIVE